MSEPRVPTLPTLEGEGLVKRYGTVAALDHVDFAVYPGEVLAVVGDNGSGKSTLVRCLSGADLPDEGFVRLDGMVRQFRNARDGRVAGVNAVYQSLKAEPALDLKNNLYRDREPSVPGPLGKVFTWMESKGLRKSAAEVASKVIILDEPTAALGARESVAVRKLIDHLRRGGLPIVVVSHSLPQVFDIADRIHVQWLGKRAAVVSPRTFTRDDVVAIMSGAVHVDEKDQALRPVP
ncbi:MAG: ATP-binding cassette domain-containing protein [Ilumatobacteraceae bacterium]